MGIKDPNPPIVRITTANVIVGRKRGRVIAWKSVQRFAPSTRAASYSSLGMLCKPARKITMFQPIPFQIPRIINVGKARVVLPNQDWVSGIRCSTSPRNQSTGPSELLKRKAKTRETTTQEVTNGK